MELYGNTIRNQLFNIFSGYALGKLPHFSLNIVFDDFNFEEAFLATLDLRLISIYKC